MAEDKVLPKGIRFFNPHDNAPDFVIASLVITPNDLVSFLKENPQLLSDYNGNKQIRLQVLKSKEGSIYSVVDTYKKGDAKPQQQAKPKQQQPEAIKPNHNDDLPF
jgi:hypothetical protein